MNSRVLRGFNITIPEGRSGTLDDRNRSSGIQELSASISELTEDQEVELKEILMEDDIDSEYNVDSEDK
jgi:hypothetical protein